MQIHWALKSDDGETLMALGFVNVHATYDQASEEWVARDHKEGHIGFGITEAGALAECACSQLCSALDSVNLLIFK